MFHYTDYLFWVSIFHIRRFLQMFYNPRCSWLNLENLTVIWSYEYLGDVFWLSFSLCTSLGKAFWGTSLDQHFFIILRSVRFPREGSFKFLLESRGLGAGIMGASILDKVLWFFEISIPNTNIHQSEVCINQVGFWNFPCQLAILLSEFR